MLKTKRTFAENIVHFYVDEEVTSFLKSQEYLKSIYDEMKSAEGLAAVYPLVIPQSDTEFMFDLMTIIKHEILTEQGQWEIFISKNFVSKNTNMQKLFSYIEITTKSEVKFLLQTIQQELKSYRELNKLKGKTFLEIDPDEKIIAFGYLEK
jgi:hypothetical protein